MNKDGQAGGGGGSGGQSYGGYDGRNLEENLKFRFFCGRRIRRFLQRLGQHDQHEPDHEGKGYPFKHRDRVYGIGKRN